MPKRKHDPDSFRAAMVGYFEDCKASSRALTLAGLAAAAGVSMSTLSRWKRDEEDEDMQDAVAWAYLVVQAFHEEALFTAARPVPHIFYLKSAFGMHDTPAKTQIEVTGKGGGPLQIVAIPMVDRSRGKD